MSRKVRINLYLRCFSIAVYEKFYLSFLYYFPLFLSVNCTNLACKLGLHFGSIKLTKDCLYWRSWSLFSTDINRIIISSCLLLLKLLLLVSKLSELSQ